LARKAFKDADIDWLVDNIKLVLVDETYVYSEAHQFLSSISAGDRIATSGNLTGKSSPAGVLFADPVTFTGLTTAKTVQGYAIYKDTGSAATSPLIVWADETWAGGPLSFSTTTHPDVRFEWPNGIAY
jgi:hypothetical protein